MRTSSITEESADIEFPSTSNDDEVICKLLSALPLASESVPSTDDVSGVNDESKETVSITKSKPEVLSFGKFFFVQFIVY